VNKNTRVIKVLLKHYVFAKKTKAKDDMALIEDIWFDIFTMRLDPEKELKKMNKD